MRMTAKPDNGCYVAIKTYNNYVTGAEVARITFPDSQTLNVWALHKVTVSVPTGCSRLMIETAVRQNGGMDICRPMLEEGDTYQGWSLSPNDITIEEVMTETGLDIKNGIIKATADTFEVRDNSGNVTARITEDGFFAGSVYATNGYFDGLIRHRKTYITKDNFHEYFAKDYTIADTTYYVPRWDRMGSNIVIQSLPEEGDFRIGLPVVYAENNPATDGRYERAREVVGSTIIVRCEGTGITLYGTSKTAPSWTQADGASTSFFLKPTYIAYLTCKVKNESGSADTDYELIYWERVVRKALP